jgi:hypothetical protein
VLSDSRILDEVLPILSVKVLRFDRQRLRLHDTVCVAIAIEECVSTNAAAMLLVTALAT